jgi:hypothetical protein
MSFIIDLKSISKKKFYSLFQLKKNQLFSKEKINKSLFFNSVLTTIYSNCSYSDIVIAIDNQPNSELIRQSINPYYKNKSNKMIDDNEKLYHSFFSELYNELIELLQLIYPCFFLEKYELIDYLNNIDSYSNTVVSFDKNLKFLNKTRIFNLNNNSIENNYSSLDKKKSIIEGNLSRNINSVFQHTHFTDDFISFLIDNGIDTDLISARSNKKFIYFESEFLKSNSKIYKRSQFRLNKKMDIDFSYVLNEIKKSKLLTFNFNLNEKLLNPLVIDFEFNIPSNKNMNNINIFQLEKIKKKLNLDVNLLDLLI